MHDGEPQTMAQTASADQTLRQTCFVTGANRRYFWLVAAAVQSLREQAPSIDIRVMDFGFSEQQAAFLADRGILLARPARVPANLHPYTLKTLFANYVAGLPHENFVWFDSDMLCTNPGIARVAALIRTMREKGAIVAACQDMGPHPTLSSFAKAFHAPALMKFVEENPGMEDRPYLNTGFIVFSSAARFLAEWPRITARIQGEVCIDQNAFNILFHGNPGAGAILPATRWNVHSGLLPSVREQQGHLSCHEDDVTLLHCTSNGNEHHEEADISIRIAGVEQKAVFKTFRQPRLRELHLGALSRFLKDNAPQLKACGVA